MKFSLSWLKTYLETEASIEQIAATLNAIHFGGWTGTAPGRHVHLAYRLVGDDYRQMLVECSMDDLVATKAVSGVLANWMKPSLERAGIDPEAQNSASVDFSGNIASANKAWKHVWSAGQGVGQIGRSYSVAELVEELRTDYRASLDRRI